MLQLALPKAPMLPVRVCECVHACACVCVHVRVCRLSVCTCVCMNAVCVRVSTAPWEPVQKWPVGHRGPDREDGMPPTPQPWGPGLFRWVEVL